MKITAKPSEEFLIEMTMTQTDILLLFGATRPGRRSKSELLRLELFGTALAAAANVPVGPAPATPKPKRERKPKPAPPGLTATLTQAPVLPYANESTYRESESATA